MKVDAVYTPDLSTPYKLPIFLGRLPAGFPSPADDYIEGRLDLNRHLIKHPAATFFVRVSGDSMTGTGIHSGNLLIVDRSLKAVDRIQRRTAVQQRAHAEAACCDRQHLRTYQVCASENSGDLSRRVPLQEGGSSTHELGPCRSNTGRFVQRPGPWEVQAAHVRARFDQ